MEVQVNHVDVARQEELRLADGAPLEGNQALVQVPHVPEREFPAVRREEDVRLFRRKVELHDARKVRLFAFDHLERAAAVW